MLAFNLRCETKDKGPASKKLRGLTFQEGSGKTGGDGKEPRIVSYGRFCNRGGVFHVGEIKPRDLIKKYAVRKCTPPEPTELKSLPNLVRNYTCVV